VLPLFAGLGWLQVAWSERRWERAPHVRAPWTKMAGVVGCIARHPGDGATFCPHQIPVCGCTPAVRDRLVRILRERQINVFAPSLHAGYGFRWDQAPAAVCQVPPAP